MPRMADEELFLPAVTPRAVVVLLHGRGMRPAALRPFASALGVPAVVCVPQGPVDDGDGCHSWWPVDAAMRERRLAEGPVDLVGEYPAGRPQARAALQSSLVRLRERFPALPLALAGFSQGGMLASEHLFLSAHPGVDALALLSSSRLAFDEWQPQLGRAAGLPVFVAHGRGDAALAFEAGIALADAYRSAGAHVQWLPFEGGHELALPVWRGLRRFLRQWLGTAELVSTHNPGFLGPVERG